MAETTSLALCGCDNPDHAKSRMSVDEAIVHAHGLVQASRSFELVDLVSACNRILSRDLYAPAQMPFFNNFFLWYFPNFIWCRTYGRRHLPDPVRYSRDH